MILRRRRLKQTLPLEQRLIDEAERLRNSANLLKPGFARDAAIKKARQMEAAAHMNEWLASPGLRPPT